MKFSDFIPAILATIGKKKFTEVDGRKVLTAEEKKNLLSYGFTERFLTDFEACLNEPVAEGEADESRQSAVVKALLGQTTAKLTATAAELETLKAEKKSESAAIAAKEKTIAELQAKIAVLSEMPEPDKGATAGRASGGEATQDIRDERQLGGRQGVMFGLDRPYNMRAKAALLASQGMNMIVADAATTDFTSLKEDLGAFYRVSWRDRLQSFLTELPTIESVFPLESGYQDLATLVNIWLGEFSQSDNSERSDFDNVTKGKYDFGTETLRMYNVMFAVKFTNLKQLEKMWIGSLNKEGSNPVKWSFIEYLLAETAKKLHNERELRRVNGVRREPDVNKPGRAMEASDGYFEFIRKKIDGHVDNTPDGGTTGKKVYQIKPFELPEITPANIGEVIYQGTSQIPAWARDKGNLRLYIPSQLLSWYHKYNESHYGQNMDYKGGINFVKEYPNVLLAPIANAEGHQRLVWTFDGNIKCFEDVPGEMLRFSMEQQDWSVKVWSNWKESIWAEAVGKKYTEKEAMDFNHQMIWATAKDRPESFFVESSADKNPSVAQHTSVITVENSSKLEITDIDNAQEGQMITLKCGVGGEKGVKISVSGKFSLLSAAWEPNKGESIKLMKRADGKFIEVARQSAASSAYAFEANDTTPSVSGATTFITGANTAATAITKLDDAVIGQTYTLYGNGSTNASTIANSGNFVLTDAMTLSDGKFIKLVAAEGGKFYEVARG